MKILWVRILIAAVVLEVLYALFLVFVLGAVEQAFTAVGISSVLVFMMLGGFWVGRNAVMSPVVQGALVGVAAVLFYTVLTIPVMLNGELEITGPLLLNHFAKILGGALGGYAATALPRPKRPAPS